MVFGTVGHIGGKQFYVISGVAHDNTAAGVFEHRAIIVAVTEGKAFLTAESEFFAEDVDALSFGITNGNKFPSFRPAVDRRVRHTDFRGAPLHLFDPVRFAETEHFNGTELRIILRNVTVQVVLF